MKEWVKSNFTIIVLVIALFSFFKGCNDTREISTLKNEIKILKDSVATKSEIRSMNNQMIEFQHTLWGFGDSYMTLLNITGESNIENKSNQKAMNKIKELNLDKK